MLVLTRGEGEVVVLRLLDGREVLVCVSSFGRGFEGGKSVRLAIDAPRDVIVFRAEMRETFAPGTKPELKGG